MVLVGVQTARRSVAQVGQRDIRGQASHSGLTPARPDRCLRHAKTTSAGAVPSTAVTAAGEKRPLGEH